MCLILCIIIEQCFKLNLHLDKNCPYITFFLSQIETVLTLTLTTASVARGKTHNIMGQIALFLLQIRKLNV